MVSKFISNKNYETKGRKAILKCYLIINEVN